MLPTLNLQISPAELLDGSFPTAPSPLPGAVGEIGTAFADLLRLGVGAGTGVGGPGGELLPEDGSRLPLLTDFAATNFASDALPKARPDARLAQLAPSTEMAGDAAAQEDLSELVLQTPVSYPAIAPADSLGERQPVGTTALAPSSAMHQPPTTANAALPVVAAGTTLDNVALAIQDRASSPVAVYEPVLKSLEPGVRQATPKAVADELALPPPASLGLRERGRLPEPQNRPAALMSAPPAAGAAERRLSLELPAQPGPLASQPADSQLDTGLEILQPRAVAPQSSQAVQTQMGAQFSHAPLTQVAVSTSSVDASYAGIAQQTGDLIGTSVRDAAWGSQLGERVVMMASNQLKSAEIRLTPAELGPLRVQITVDDGAANVTFHAQHAVTREAIEQALPRLREMLAENGLSLGQADVSDRGIGEGNRDGEPEGGLSEAAGDDGQELAAELDARTARRVTTSNGLVDTFA